MMAIISDDKAYFICPLFLSVMTFFLHITFHWMFNLPLHGLRAFISFSARSNSFYCFPFDDFMLILMLSGSQLCLEISV
ncbi:LOW QUALITY PROTEIN: hypothetical protein TorRG33x02_320930 [Trema orientale]|uniref:Uncharacterized protein n=1 Tax=Trema orientale TaxID=63057 RepID=A0A2P5BHP3_TREOI|nr:LOW QUALITY PROTEIN: hypothetical protein TorRG33x02_320930 [Trema orientale]